MAEANWRRGRVLGPRDDLDIDSCAVVAQVHSRALRADDGGHVASYVLVDGLDEPTATAAMNFFSSQVSLLVDASALVEDCAAEFPALVTIRMTDEFAGYVAQSRQYDFLRDLPGDDIISSDGWDAFCARIAIERGEEVPEVGVLPDFDERDLRRKIYANRAKVKEDRSPWLIEEYNQLKKVTEGSPEGSETLVAMMEDMGAALDGSVTVGDTFSVVIPTRVERAVQDGALRRYIPQTGREIVVAHGLDGIQAGKVLRLVEEDRERFVDAKQLLSTSQSRETLYPPFIVPDTGLNWISTDFAGRRNQAAYAALQAEVGARGEEQEGKVMPVAAQSAQR